MCGSLYVRLHTYVTCISVCVLVNGPACICAAFWPQQPINTAVCWTVRCAWPPAMATRPKDSHRSVLRRGLVHCLKVTGLVDGAVRDANGCPARPGSCSSTMNLSVTPRLPPAVLPHTAAKNNPPPNVTDTSCLLLGTQRWNFCRRLSRLKTYTHNGHVGHPCL